MSSQTAPVGQVQQGQGPAQLVLLSGSLAPSLPTPPPSCLAGTTHRLMKGHSVPGGSAGEGWGMELLCSAAWPTHGLLCHLEGEPWAASGTRASAGPQPGQPVCVNHTHSRGLAIRLDQAVVGRGAAPKGHWHPCCSWLSSFPKYHQLPSVP